MVKYTDQINLNPKYQHASSTSNTRPKSKAITPQLSASSSSIESLIAIHSKPVDVVKVEALTLIKAVVIDTPRLAKLAPSPIVTEEQPKIATEKAASPISKESENRLVKDIWLTDTEYQVIAATITINEFLNIPEAYFGVYH